MTSPPFFVPEHAPEPGRARPKSPADLFVAFTLLALLHAQYAHHPAVAGALRGMAAVSAGMIGAAGLKLSVALARNPMPLPWCIAISGAGFVLVALLRLPLFPVLFGLGGLGCVLAYRRLTS